MNLITYEQLDGEQRGLVDAAAVAMEGAYNPYSNFFVGAAVLTVDGEKFTGSNFENGAYGSTMCAERIAAYVAHAEGKRMLRTVAIIARGKDFDTEEPTAPCGSCRQVFKEFRDIGGKDIEFILSTTRKDKIWVASLDALLPGGFGPASLKIDIGKYR